MEPLELQRVFVSKENHVHSGLKIIIFGVMGLFLVAFGISINSPMGYHPIANIVKGGNVFLEGVIDNKEHKNRANLKARGVSGVFSVTNNLQVLNPPQEKK